jgi:flagellar hook assembly protein FlgD
MSTHSFNVERGLVLSALASAASGQTLGVSPSVFSQGDEAFLQISLSGIVSEDSVLVTFTDGSPAIEPQVVGDGSLIVWVPQGAMNNPGTYSVYVDVTRNAATTRYGPAQITINALPDPATLPAALTLPEVVLAEAASANGAVVTFSATASNSAPVACSPSSGSNFPLGTSNVNCSAGAATGSLLVAVYDTVPPLLTVPADRSTSNPVVNFTVTATDAIDPAPVVECAPLSGSTFPIGTTTVSCAATDLHTNSTARTFQVNVTNGSPVTISNLGVSELYFSPNADGSKDTTTVFANAPSVDTIWTVTITSSSGASVLSANRTGTTLSFTWDGRDASGAVQADGAYALALQAVDGAYSATATASTFIDRTIPTATIASPVSGAVFSNVRQNGSISTIVNGTANDANVSAWTVSAGPVGGTLTVFATGVSNVANATLGTWGMDGLSNGPYTLRFEVRDRAGNIAIADSTVTLAHFSASQATYEFNPAGGQTVIYTSIVPFAVTQTLTIRNAAGTTVRALVNGSRAAGTYADAWNGRDDGGVLLPDGPYSYVATVTEGTNVLTWDLSNQMRAAADTQFPYPSCSSRNMTIATCEANAQSGGQYDVFANDPLKIHYSVAQPSRVYVVLTDADETPGLCTGSEVCVAYGKYRATGSYVEVWPGVLPSGDYAPSRRKLTVVRRTSTFPKNVVVLYGSGSVTVTNVTLTPPAYGPEGGSMNIELDVATIGNAPATVTLQMIRQATSTSAKSTLRTITYSEQSSGHRTYTWDGKADSGHRVAPGEYALIVTAAAGGSSSQAESRFVVIY